MHACDMHAKSGPLSVIIIMVQLATFLNTVTGYHLSIMILFSVEPFGPVVTVMQVGHKAISDNGMLTVELDQGGPAPTFSCSSDSPAQTSFTWQRINGDRRIPNGVTQGALPKGQNGALIWNRVPLFTDSSIYSCTGSNMNGNNSVTLELTIIGELPL